MGLLKIGTHCVQDAICSWELKLLPLSRNWSLDHTKCLQRGRESARFYSYCAYPQFNDIYETSKAILNHEHWSFLHLTDSSKKWDCKTNYLYYIITSELCFPNLCVPHRLLSCVMPCKVTRSSVQTFGFLTSQGHHAEVWCLAVSQRGDFLVCVLLLFM